MGIILTHKKDNKIKVSSLKTSPRPCSLHCEHSVCLTSCSRVSWPSQDHRCISSPLLASPLSALLSSYCTSLLHPPLECKKLKHLLRTGSEFCKILELPKLTWILNSVGFFSPLSDYWFRLLAKTRLLVSILLIWYIVFIFPKTHINPVRRQYISHAIKQNKKLFWSSCCNPGCVSPMY